VDDSYITPSAKKLALAMAAKNKPRILVCAPSNAAVDNIILKIMETGFVDGNGSRYNPSIIRVGSGQSTLVQPVSLESKINDYLSSKNDVSALDSEISMHKSELNKIQSEIFRLRRRIDAISNAAPWELAKVRIVRSRTPFVRFFIP
jgi:senataxin